MRPGLRSALPAVLVLALAGLAAGCAGAFEEEYEYEEELYLSLDGSATLNVHASIASLVALYGADLDPSPLAQLDRTAVRALFEGPGVVVRSVSASRRDGRRFVHVSLDVDDVRRLPRVAPFADSSYELVRRADAVEFRQVVRSAAAAPVDGAGWTGEELVAFRMHVPSEIPFHNAPEPPRRGNILVWEQPLAERLMGVPLELRVTMEPESILYTTLVLFGSTILAVAATFALVIWWIARQGREEALAESES